MHEASYYQSEIRDIARHFGIPERELSDRLAKLLSVYRYDAIKWTLDEVDAMMQGGDIFKKAKVTILSSLD